MIIVINLNNENYKVVLGNLCYVLLLRRLSEDLKLSPRNFRFSILHFPLARSLVYLWLIKSYV